LSCGPNAGHGLLIIMASQSHYSRAAYVRIQGLPFPDENQNDFYHSV